MNYQLFSKTISTAASNHKEGGKAVPGMLAERLQAMIQDSRKKIVILFGGCSSEYSVSLQSAYAVVDHINRERYCPILVGITREGDWYLYLGDIGRIPEDTWCGFVEKSRIGKGNESVKGDGLDCIPVVISPDRSSSCLLAYTKEGGSVVRIPVDAAFPVLHGRNGEDGTVQGALELAGIPVVGCGVLASALCMDKDRAHKLVHEVGIRVPKSYVLTNPRNAYHSSPSPDYSEPEFQAACQQMERELKVNPALISDAVYRAESIGYPLFVKPVKAGSSYGVTKVCKRTEIADAIRLAFKYDDTVIVEEAINGFEVGCAVMGNVELTVGEVDEIELQNGFFDYTEKYTLKTSAIHVPARITEETAERIKQTAQTIYQTLGCQGFARVDMFLTPEDEIVFNEVNTIPGFTAHSRFPNMMKAVGITFEEIIDTVIQLALPSVS